MVEQMSGLSSEGDIAIDRQLREKPQSHMRKWYFSRYEIIDCSPSRKDGIDFEEESGLRKLYCSYIQDLGRKLKVPQVTIACALVLCHRFYMRQSHAKNGWQTIATASVFLACKIEETPRLLRDVAVVAYKMMHRWDPSAPQRIRRIEFCNSQKELITTAERLLLETVAFDLNIQLPYKPLVFALKKLNIYPDLAKVAWNFVNDWLCTTLCLQYKPHYIAAGSMFLAAKFQKVKLPTEKGKIWWLEFDISPKQLEEVIQEMVRLLEQDKKQALPLPLPPYGRVVHSIASVGKKTMGSPQSTITSMSIGSSHSSDGAATESQVSSKENLIVKEVLPCQASGNFASSISNAGSVESQSRIGEFNSSSKIVLVHSSYGKIDSNQIRERLKRRRLEAHANKRTSEPMNTDIGIDAWIESELENGIVLESTFSEKKRRHE